MKLHRIAVRALSGLALASFVSVASISVAAAGTPAVILIVNSDQLFTQSKVGQNVREQIQTLSKKLQSESAKAENSLKAEAKKLGEQRALLKEEDFAKKVQAFQKKEQDTQQRLQAKGQALQLGANVARNKVEEAIRPIFADVLKAHDANILLDQSTVLAGGVDLDVTAEIVKALDAKLTSVKVTPMTPADLKK
jgi:Skp family chaperone for outer membrane proteins